jgi:2-polyprenyl-3-methyl-5-hydroxy-6-metoxy-1,4-benzoquinol methylase
MKVKDFIVSNEFFKLYTDSETGITWTEVKKNHNHLSYYQSENYLPHSQKRGLFSYIYMFSQQIMFFYKKTVLKKYLNTSSLVLDYGSGDGKFAKYIERNCKKVLTYDPIKDHTNETTKLLQNADLQVDMIMMWHVLEHIPDMLQVLPKLIEKITPKGYLVIAVPNNNCFDSKVYNQNWAAWDAPRHLYHFNHKSLIKLMDNHSLSLVSKKPLFLDSFYVSYLSEKNKKSYFPWISAVIIGMTSNILALFSSNYSSSVYVFKRD